MKAADPVTAVAHTFLTPQEQACVQEMIREDPVRLALALHKRTDIDPLKVIRQVAARQKAVLKLPVWYANEQLVFPAPLSVEQASSQATAAYKAALIQGESLVDITLGMGVDTCYFARRFHTITGYEQNPELAALTAHNLACLGAVNVRVVAGNALEHLHGKADWIYADPARRDERQRKVTRLSDCTPDIAAALPLLFQHTDRLLIKTSPVLDIDLAVSSLGHVSEVHVVGYEKECKEVVYLLDKRLPAAHPPRLTAVLLPGDRTLSFTRREEEQLSPEYSDPLTFLYEPHPAFMKSGAFKTIAHAYNVLKIAPSSHLYTADTFVPDFPGRSFRVRDICAPDKKAVAAGLDEARANLTVRNFPASVDDLRRKLRLKEGGDAYLFATTLFSGKKVILVTTKL